MGLYTIDNVCREERLRRARIHHERIRWAITIAEILLIAGMITGLVFLGKWLGI